MTDLKAVNPRIVCGHLSAYGRTGPRASWPAYDYLMQAEAGYLDLTGEPGSPPTRMGLSMIDYMTGVTARYAVTAALLGAARSGQGVRRRRHALRRRDASTHLSGDVVSQRGLCR